MKPYPWQLEPWQGLMDRVGQGRLGHGFLFTGPEGLGKQHFARALAGALLCQSTVGSGVACGTCASCRLLEAGTHPDFKLIEPAEKGKAILVDQIRELVDYLSLTPHLAGRKLVVINDAERMNTAASNSLLKSLEEPPADVVIILVSSREAALLATIRSRCQRLVFSIPDTAIAKQWLDIQLLEKTDSGLLLALAAGAPLRALAFAESDILSHRQSLLKDLTEMQNPRSDVLAVAKAWLKLDFSVALYWLNSWVVDMLRLQAAAEPPMIDNPDIRDRLQDWAGHFNQTALLNYYQRLSQAQGQLDANANPHLLLEELLISWRRLVVRR